MLFKGSAVALVTPFTKSDEVDYIKLKELIEFQIASGTKAIVILGTTGESATITDTERSKIIKFCVYQVSKRVPVIVGTGSNSTATAICLTKEAETLGADGALIVTPYYNKCNQTGLILHYKSIAKSTNLPIIIYNVPSRTGVNILPETVKILSRIRNIVGIKEANDNINQIVKLLSIIPKKFAVYSGNDLITFPMMCLGALGVISVTANAYPEKCALMCEHLLKKDIFNALRLHNHLIKINTSLFADVNPICIKYYLNEMGIFVGQTRSPLSPPSKETTRKLIETRRFYED